MTIYLGNAISLNMLTAGTESAQFRCHRISEAVAAGRLAAPGAANTIGHADLARIVTAAMAAWGTHVPPAQRVTVVLRPGDELIVAQATGPRLPEGCTSLPPGAEIVWWSVTVEDVPVA